MAQGTIAVSSDVLRESVATTKDNIRRCPAAPAGGAGNHVFCTRQERGAQDDGRMAAANGVWGRRVAASTTPTTEHALQQAC
jgi:hypothetical protein